MRYGHKTQLDKWLNKVQDPAKVADALNKVKWINQEWWYVPGDGDGPEEAAKLEALKKSLKLSNSVSTSIPTQTSTSLTINNKPVPPVKKAPGLIGKAVQMFKTVAGPTVSQAVYEKRLSKCTREGGLTFSPIKGIVEAVGTNFVQVDKMAILLPSDEVPDVVVGQSVEIGQLIAASKNAKPCPYLKVKPSKDGEQLWCRSCGCGEKTLAELHNKLRYARLTCPRSFPLFTAEDDPTTDPPTSPSKSN